MLHMLALIGGLVVIIGIIYVFQRSYRIASLSNSLQLVIRLAWGDNDISDHDAQDDSAIETISTLAKKIDHKKQYMLFVAAVAAMPGDVIKNRDKLSQLLQQLRHFAFSRWG